jgi:apolipoprotein N-acyltransferase
MMLPVMQIPLRTYLPAVGSGLLLAFCFPTFHWWPLAWVALVPLLWQARQLPPNAAALRFFLTGYIFHSIVLQWLIANIFWAGGWAVVGQQLLCISLALFWALAGFVWRRAALRAPALVGAVALAVLWGALEWMHASLFTGFGWCALGYSQGADLAVAQWAAIGGVTLVSCFIVSVNALLALPLAERKGYWRLGAAVGVVVAVHAGGYVLLDQPRASESDFTAGIFQSNYPQEMKWDWEYAEEMVARAVFHSERLAEFEAIDLLVWPEALLVWPYDDPRMRAPIEAMIRTTGVPLLTGATRAGESGESEYNTAVFFNAAGAPQAFYDKIHLAPMGEYIPFEQYLPFLAGIVPGGGISAGSEPKVFPFEDRTLGPLVCFEVLFGPYAERLRSMGADCLVVVTNLGWFGASNAMAQELELARFRAIETRLPLVHSANTGISGVFDPWGRFQVIDGAVGSGGRYYRWEAGEVTPRSVEHRRRVGAVHVPAPGRRPLPFGPAVFPWAVLVSLLLLAGAVWRWPAVQPSVKSRLSRKPDPNDAVSI